MKTKIIMLAFVVFASAGKMLKAQNKSDSSKKLTEEYGNNIISLSPVKAMDIGVGFGLSYEAIVSKDKKVGLVFPVSVLLNNHNRYDYIGNVYYDHNNDYHYFTYFYFTPGMKFYPGGQKTVTYAIGPNLMIGYGGGKYQVIDNQYVNDTTTLTQKYNVKESTLRFGVIVNNYVNFQLSQAFNFGLSFGLGVRYINIEKRTSDDVQYNNTTYNPLTITEEATLTFGYRF